MRIVRNLAFVFLFVVALTVQPAQASGGDSWVCQSGTEADCGSLYFGCVSTCLSENAFVYDFSCDYWTYAGDGLVCYQCWCIPIG